jgi:hypothetical protein
MGDLAGLPAPDGLPGYDKWAHLPWQVCGGVCSTFRRYVRSRPSRPALGSFSQQ